MRATILALGVVLGALAAAPPVQAQYYCPVIPQAPDAYGWSYYQPNYYGQWYGPNYCLYPPFQPFQGMVFPPPPPAAPGSAANGGRTFPSQPFARSPRDFFMYN